MPGSAVQNLQDFHTLLHPHGNILDLRIRIHLQVVAPGKLQDPVSRRFDIHRNAFFRLHAKNNIFGYGKWLDQHKMLVYHTDPQVDRLLRAVDDHLFPIDGNGSFRRLVQTIQNVHQRTFSGTVFS